MWTLFWSIIFILARFSSCENLFFIHERPEVLRKKGTAIPIEIYEVDETDTAWDSINLTVHKYKLKGGEDMTKHEDFDYVFCYKERKLHKEYDAASYYYVIGNYFEFFQIDDTESECIYRVTISPMRGDSPWIKYTRVSYYIVTQNKGRLRRFNKACRQKNLKTIE